MTRKLASVVREIRAAIERPDLVELMKILMALLRGVESCTAGLKDDTSPEGVMAKRIGDELIKYLLHRIMLLRNRHKIRAAQMNRRIFSEVAFQPALFQTEVAIARICSTAWVLNLLAGHEPFAEVMLPREEPLNMSLRALRGVVRVPAIRPFYRETNRDLMRMISRFVDL